MHPLITECLALLEREGLDEVLAQGGRPTVGVRQGRRAYEGPPLRANAVALVAALQEMAHGQDIRLDPLHPCAGGDARCDDGHARWYALLPPVAVDGPLLSVRRHRFQTLGLDDFAGGAEARPHLEAAFQEGRSVFIAGATGSGKTSLLVSWLKERSFAERVFLLEEIREIPSLSPHWVSLCPRRPNVEGRGSFLLGHVFEATLRLRPDRFVVGELRGAEVDVLLQVMLSGHGATMTTLHLGDPACLAERLAQMSERYDEAMLRKALRRWDPLVLMMRATGEGKPGIAGVWSYGELAHA